MKNVAEMFHEPNWLRRDIQIKKRLGFNQEYWQRGAKVLRLAERQGGQIASSLR
jgi:uncharacterized protein (DUF2249 family)